jgi:hypothetical protein
MTSIARQADGMRIVSTQNMHGVHAKVACRLIGRVLLVVMLVRAMTTTDAAFGADFRVTGRVVTPAFEGFGVNVSPFVYCAPNWPGEVNETNVVDLERKVLELRPQIVRIFILPTWWEKEAERDKARSVERLCQLMGRAGATVNLTLWGGKYDPTDMGRRMAAVFAHLIRDERLACVRYATLQNEPNSFDMDKAKYVTLYRVFDAELRRLGVREHLKIVGGDLVSTDQDAWFERMAADLFGVLDGYAVHEYSDYWDPARMLQRVSEVPPIVASLPAAGRKPIYLMEFGVRGHRKEKNQEPGLYEDGRQMCDVSVEGNQLACYIVEAVNRGYVATCQWDLVDVLYDRSRMQYGAIGAPKDGFPLKPAYSLLRMFTHSAGVGWSVVKVEGEADLRSVAAMRSKEGRWVIFAVNRAAEVKTLSVGGLPRGVRFGGTVWNGDGKGAVGETAGVTVDDQGTMVLSMPPMSVVALTGGPER